MTKFNKTIQWITVLAIAAASSAYAQVASSGPMVAVPALLEGGGSLVLVAGGGAGQVKDDLFAGTEKFGQGASQVTEVNLDPKMLKMVHGHGDSSVAHKMKFMVIHTYTYDKPGMYKMEDVEAYRKKLDDGTWNCSVHVREKNGSTDICSRTPADHEGSEMVILTAEPKELTFIHMSGTMSLEDLSRMGGGMGGATSHSSISVTNGNGTTTTEHTTTSTKSSDQKH